MSKSEHDNRETGLKTKLVIKAATLDYWTISGDVLRRHSKFYNAFGPSVLLCTRTNQMCFVIVRTHATCCRIQNECLHLEMRMEYNFFLLSNTDCSNNTGEGIVCSSIPFNTYFKILLLSLIWVYFPNI